MPNFNVKKKTTTEIDGQITAEDIRKAFNLPADAIIYLPDGANWIDVADHPLTVKWVSIKEEAVMADE